MLGGAHSSDVVSRGKKQSVTRTVVVAWWRRLSEVAWWCRGLVEQLGVVVACLDRDGKLGAWWPDVVTTW